jgi:hypothetical protein
MHGTFRPPQSFVDLYRAGRFDYWGGPYNSFTEAERALRIRTHEKRVLWWRTIEWDRELEEIEAFKGDGHLRPGLVPFAGDGYGNHYCWYPRWQEGPEPPVVFASNDDDEGRLFARTFAECLCRCFLEHFALAGEAPDEPDEGENRGLWEAHLGILRPFLAPEQDALLASVGKQLSGEACDEAEDHIAGQVGRRTLAAFQPPTRYYDDPIDDGLLKAYDASVAFYRELVEVEGLSEFRPKLIRRGGRPTIGADPLVRRVARTVIGVSTDVTGTNVFCRTNRQP